MFDVRKSLWEKDVIGVLKMYIGTKKLILSHFACKNSMRQHELSFFLCLRLGWIGKTADRKEVGIPKVHYWNNNQENTSGQLQAKTSECAPSGTQRTKHKAWAFARCHPHKNAGIKGVFFLPEFSCMWSYPCSHSGRLWGILKTWGEKWKPHYWPMQHLTGTLKLLSPPFGSHGEEPPFFPHSSLQSGFFFWWIVFLSKYKNFFLQPHGLLILPQRYTMPISMPFAFFNNVC